MNQGEDLRAVHPVIRTNRELLVIVAILALIASLIDNCAFSYHRLEGLIRELRFHQANQRRHPRRERVSLRASLIAEFEGADVSILPQLPDEVLERSLGAQP